MPASAPSDAAASGAALQLDNLAIHFANPPGPPRRILDAATLHLPAGAQVALEGPSGAGKSSLLHALAGIEPPTAGRIRWAGTDLATLAASQRDAWRRTRIGLVFQDFHLIEGLSPGDNVLLPIWFGQRRVPPETRARAAALLAAMGLPAAMPRLGALSRGERQRVALARALLHAPPILLADEPTASLDAATGEAIASLLLEHAQATGATLIIATHDAALRARLPIRLRIEAGRLERLA